MGRYSTTLDDDDDDDDDDYEDDDRDDPDGADMDDGDAEFDGATQECPHCGEEISEYAEKCPACDRYLSKEDAPPRTDHPRWVVITAIIILVPMLYALLRWFL
jgi:uncharacterized protein (DUF983 family)